MTQLTPTSKELLTIAQAADYALSSASTIKRRIKDGKLSAVRNGRKLYVSRADLDALFTPVAVGEAELAAALARRIAADAPRLSPESKARLASLLS